MCAAFVNASASTNTSEELNERSESFDANAVADVNGRRRSEDVERLPLVRAENANTRYTKLDNFCRLWFWTSRWGILTGFVLMGMLCSALVTLGLGVAAIVTYSEQSLSSSHDDQCYMGLGFVAVAGLCYAVMPPLCCCFHVRSRRLHHCCRYQCYTSLLLVFLLFTVLLAGGTVLFVMHCQETQWHFNHLYQFFALAAIVSSCIAVVCLVDMDGHPGNTNTDQSNTKSIPVLGMMDT